jgi:hypothetical protein
MAATSVLATIVTRLFLKAADGHIALIHSNEVPALMVLSHIEVPMGFVPWLAIFACSERERTCGERVQGSGSSLNERQHRANAMWSGLAPSALLPCKLQDTVRKRSGVAS